MMTHHTPSEVVERLIGRPEVVGAAIEVHPKTPYWWRKASAWRAAGDIPPIAQRKLLIHSDRHCLGLTAKHLILGAEASEIDAILAARESRSAA
jgi:hypothetical protein